MRKIIVVLLAFCTSSAFCQTNSLEWLQKIPRHIKNGTSLGSLVSRCAVQVYPSDSSSSEMYVAIERTRIIDNDTLASIELKHTDILTGSSKYPAGPYETQDILSFGYREKAPQGQFDKALIIKSRGENRIAVTIETNVNGKISSETCVVERKNRDY